MQGRKPGRGEGRVPGASWAPLCVCPRGTEVCSWNLSGIPGLLAGRPWGSRVRVFSVRCVWGNWGAEASWGQRQRWGEGVRPDLMEQEPEGVQKDKGGRGLCS